MGLKRLTQNAHRNMEDTHPMSPSDITSLMVDNTPPTPSFSDITRRGYVRARRIFGQTIFIFSLISRHASRSFVRHQNPTTTSYPPFLRARGKGVGGIGVSGNWKLVTGNFSHSSLITLFCPTPESDDDDDTDDILP